MTESQREEREKGLKENVLRERRKEKIRQRRCKVIELYRKNEKKVKSQKVFEEIIIEKKISKTHPVI
jgi:hypothetical protein